MSADIAWLAGLSPWPADGFGLDRMTSSLALSEIRSASTRLFMSSAPTENRPRR